MMKPEELLRRIRTERHNVRFRDFIRLAEAHGFGFDRQHGSHCVYKHPCGAVLNLQERDGEAKPYQLLQFLELVDAYGLRMR
ncbi:MAG: type II toxin-antitoxin system HicA family toxin [Elusimicrobia bacterium]|nr:type II toxin-antitoxin system HicA family toxin [Elusimicrobiota bacterium]